MPNSLESLKQQAEALARQETQSAEAVIALVNKLKKQDEFPPARELLDQVRHRLSADPLHTKLAQEHALCTYKDANFPADKRYHQALAILAEIGLGDPQCRDKETLGQGGAIHKRLWETTGLMEHLHTALAFYRAGCACGVTQREDCWAAPSCFRRFSNQRMKFTQHMRKLWQTLAQDQRDILVCGQWRALEASPNRLHRHQHPGFIQVP
ncbi:tetratricopeptide repeat-containing protein [Aquaspirillum sp. LM1]|uniref:tetratricopeptide repeat-containing protein n=1 Tax=Aquaspirillum sp. LM1 TaxID=1938604 RepID=UPI00209B9B3E|nr:tetratricopeptide repeat-containing protein [Aquaspirillum sp. LM1]